MDKKKIAKAIITVLTALATAIGIVFGVTSCTFTRTVTTTSESHTRGDTAVVIQSKTIESYHGSKHQ